ncbi:MAG: hypothetical protein LBR74_02630 [Eubacterium sp.]|jgi:hypothetical protein|nr:hypothetical protein [Eubacterium sp.]
MSEIKGPENFDTFANEKKDNPELKEYSDNLEKSLEEESPFKEMTPEQESAFEEFDKMQAEIEGTKMSDRTERVLESFKSENWKELSPDERMDKCDELCDSIADDLELSVKPRVCYDKAEDIPDGAEASYDDKDNTIHINKEHLDNPSQLANIIGHETRHTYQHEQAEHADSTYGYNCKESFDKKDQLIEEYDYVVPTEHIDSLFTEQDADEYGNLFSDWLENH